MVARRKSELSEGFTKLLELMQRINFGRIEGLLMQDGQPIFDPPPAWVQSIKFSADNTSRPEIPMPDFDLRHEVLELFALLARPGVSVRFVDIKHGLPFRAEVGEVGA